MTYSSVALCFEAYILPAYFSNNQLTTYTSWMYQKFLLIACLILTLPITAERYSVGFVHFPPFLYVDDQQQAHGIFHDIVLKRLLRETDYEFDYVVMPSRRLYSSFNAGKIDLLISAHSPEVMDSAIFANEILSSVMVNLYSTNPISNTNLTSILKGTSLGVLQGYSYVGWLDKLRRQASALTLKIHPLSSRKALFNSLNHGRIDHLLAYNTPARHALGDKLVDRHYHRKLTQVDIRFLIYKKMRNAKLLAQDLDKQVRIYRQP